MKMNRRTAIDRKSVKIKQIDRFFCRDTGF